MLLDAAIVFRERVWHLADTYSWLIPMFLWVTLGMAGLTVLGGWLIWKKSWELHRVFVVMAGVCGIFYMFVMPPFTAPDEDAHYATVYYYSDKLLGQNALTNKGMTIVRTCDVEYQEKEHREPSIGSYDAVWNGLFSVNHSDKMQSYNKGPLNSVSWALYVPQILGVTLARILHLGNIPLLFLGRFFALLFYVALCSLAIKKMPFGKLALFVVALLPMPMEEAASLSYDCVINAVSFFFIANSLDLVYRREKVEKKDWIVMILLAFFVLSGKIIYILLAGLGILIPAEKFPKPVLKWVYTGAVFAGGAAAVLASRLGALVNYLSRETYVAAAFETEGYTFQYLLAHPDRALKVFFKTWKEYGDDYLFTAIGKKPGWMNMEVSDLLIVGFLILLLVAAIRVKDEPVFLDAKAKIVMGICCVLIASGVVMAMWIAWTPLDSDLVMGVQGRYFLPIFPLLLMLLRSKNLSLEKDVNGQVVVGVGILQFFVLLYILEYALLR